MLKESFRGCTLSYMAKAHATKTFDRISDASIFKFSSKSAGYQGYGSSRIKNLI